MNKNKFISELEKRLKVLNENERKDIINEYSDIINEKVKNGESEEQAVLEFGDIDELVKEILESYKINPDYDNNFSKKAKEVANNTEDFIKKSAKKLADTTQNVVDDFKKSGNTLTLEMIFEIIIKVFVFLIILSLLRIPFYILRSFGGSVFEGIFSPFDFGFSVIWRIFVWLLYIICCILVGIVFFKDYFNKLSAANSTEINKDSVKKNNNLNNAQPIDNRVNNNTTNREVGSKGITNVLFKMLAIIFIMIPVGSIVSLLFMATGISIYFFIEGLPILGLCISLIGLSLGASWIFDIFYRLIFTKRKIYIAMFFISLITTIVGGIIFVSDISNINFYNERPNVEIDNYTKTFEIDEHLYIYDMYNHDIIVDNSIPDDTAIVSIDYYKELNDIEVYGDGDRKNRISLDHSPKKGKEFFRIIIDNLKNDKIYNYAYLFKGEVTIKVNPNTRDKIIVKD